MAEISSDARVTCPAVPVQIEGHLTDGRWFYFNSRYDRALLGVGDTLQAAVAATIDLPPGRSAWVDMSHLGRYGAGSIGVDEAFDLLREMAADLPDPAAS